jgi:hypothetical protein
MKSSIFWGITPCSSPKVNRRFGGICRLHLQSQRIIQARNQRESRACTCFYIPEVRTLHERSNPEMIGWWALTAIQKPNKSNWMMHLLILFTLSVTVWAWISQVYGQEEEDKLRGPLVLLKFRPWTLSFGAMWKTRCRAKKWMRWMNSNHGSLQQMRMLQRICYITSDKRWSTGGMYAELHVALIGNCFALNNFSIYV